MDRASSIKQRKGRERAEEKKPDKTPQKGKPARKAPTWFMKNGKPVHLTL